MLKGFVYVLFSLKDRRTYVGSTDDLNRRLQQHINGLVKSTKNRLPVKLIYEEKFESLADARKKEKYFKSCAGRKKLAIILNNIELPQW